MDIVSKYTALLGQQKLKESYAGTVKLTNLDNGESNISFPSCDDGLIINPADKHIK